MLAVGNTPNHHRDSPDHHHLTCCNTRLLVCANISATSLNTLPTLSPFKPQAKQNLFVAHTSHSSKQTSTQEHRKNGSQRLVNGLYLDCTFALHQTHTKQPTPTVSLFAWSRTSHANALPPNFRPHNENVAPLLYSAPRTSVSPPTCDVHFRGHSGQQVSSWTALPPEAQHVAQHNRSKAASQVRWQAPAKTNHATNSVYWNFLPASG